MRAITPPTLDPKIVYQTCVNSISDNDLNNRLRKVLNNIIQSAINYQKNAVDRTFYKIIPNHCRNHEVALGSVTKAELRAVYSSHMVPSSKPARVFYDELLLLAPLGKCPYCAVGHASTLDHYLPKNKFPQLAIIPLNLIPACKDCNTGKKSGYPTKPEEQTLHPYFDHHSFIKDQWLFAKVIETTPAVIQFFVRPPSYWDDTSKARVNLHFNDFSLSSRYSIEASNQLASLRSLFLFTCDELGANGIKQQLMQQSRAFYHQHHNSWQTAMYQALAESDWYCNGGFK